MVVNKLYINVFPWKAYLSYVLKKVDLRYMKRPSLRNAERVNDALYCKLQPFGPQKWLKNNDIHNIIHKSVLVPIAVPINFD